MATKQNINIASKLTSPEGEFSVAAQGKSFPTESFTSDEARLLENQLNDLLFGTSGSTIKDLLVERQNAIALSAAFAKNVFDEKLFGGLNAGDNEIAFDVLRPGHIRSDPANGNVQNDWFFEPASTGWNDWIGDGGANDKTFTDDQVSVIVGMVDQDVNTSISGINVDSFGRNMDMLPMDMNTFRTADNDGELFIRPLPTLVGQENDDVHIRLRHDRVAESQPRLLGFTFGLGTWMNSEDY